MLEAVKPDPASRQTTRVAVPWRRVVPAIGLLLAIASHGLAEDSTDEHVFFTFSTDPAEAVLSFSSRGGLLMVQPAYVIYGDGRMECQQVTYGGRVLERYESQLERSAVEELLLLAVNQGLLETSTEQISEELRRRTRDGRFPKVVDAPDVTIRISLTSYIRGGEEQGPISIEVTVHSPVVLARRFDIEELKGFATFSLHIRDVGRRICREHEEENQ